MNEKPLLIGRGKAFGSEARHHSLLRAERASPEAIAHGERLSSV